jgi:hypothetical protein
VGDGYPAGYSFVDVRTPSEENLVSVGGDALARHKAASRALSGFQLLTVHIEPGGGLE